MNETDTNAWLKQAKANGISLAMPELLAYRAQPLRLPIPRFAGAAMQAGPRLSRTRGRGMEFDEVRHYQAGDDIRAIDWRVTARTGKTHTKLYREEKERPVFICADLSASMGFGSQLLFKSVQAAHIAAGIAWHAVQRGDRVGGVVFNQQQHVELKPAARQHGVLLLLQQLIALHPAAAPIAAADTAAQTSLHAQLQRLLQLCRPGADVVIISDFSQLDSRCIKLLQALRRHHSVMAILISDPLEQQVPQQFRRDIVAFDGAQHYPLGFSNRATHEHWQQAAEQWLTRRMDALRQASHRVIEITAGLPATQQWQMWRGRA